MKTEIWNHIIKRFSDTENSTSKAELDLWLAKSRENQKKYQEIVLLWQLTGKLKPEETFEIPDFEIDLNPVNSRKKLNAYWAYGIAAACVVAIFVFGLNFIKNNNTSPSPEWTTQTADLGKMLSVTLPDHSTVILNSGSSIRYQKDFAKNNRRLVQLSGEAFFDVIHSSKQPFVVESGQIKTIVFGTSFNVRAYKNERRIQVSVKSGKVGVLKKQEQSKPVFLLPNNSLTFDTLSNAFSKIRTTINLAGNWKNGSLIFEETPIMEVLATLSRRFNVKFNTSDYQHPSCKLTAKFERKDLPIILKTIQTVMNIEINQIDQTIYLKGGNTCK